MAEIDPSVLKDLLSRPKSDLDPQVTIDDVDLQAPTVETVKDDDAKLDHDDKHHWVREAVAAQVFDFWHIPGTENPADILSKHWAHNKVSHVLRPMLFWRGDTLDCVSLS